MPSSAPDVQPIQFVTLPIDIFAKTTFIIPLIIEATLPMRSVCFITV